MKATKKVKRVARELFRLCVVDGVLDGARARKVAAHLAGSGHRGALSMLSEFQRLVRLDRDRRTALVESALPLGGSLRNAIQARITDTYGPELRTVFTENPALIGGIRVKIGSDVYDGSIRAKLAALERQL